jgi:hypothetical protein
MDEQQSQDHRFPKFMNVGTAELEITPKPGIDLAGFAIRPQPSASVLDPLYVRALFLENGPERLLWLHCDLLALEQTLADRIRRWCQEKLTAAGSQVIVSTTHTHSGPATIQSNGCGRPDETYIAWVERQLRDAASLATAQTEPCRLIHAQGLCHRAIDRRGFASAHTDPRVGAFGWLREDGTFKAALMTYAMHPVCLRGSQISADWPGASARCLSQSLPGGPVCLVCSGACGNINPPAVGVDEKTMNGWGEEVAVSVVGKLIAATRHSVTRHSQSLRATGSVLNLPLAPWGEDDLDDCVAACRADAAGHREFGEKFERAIESWHSTMLRRFRSGEPPVARAVLGVVRLGGATLLTVNAEVFSRFNDLTTNGASRSIYTIGCANGMIGYLATAEAYDEGAYEVAWSMLFYNLPRPRRGGLEALACQARRLLSECESNHLQESQS